MTASELESTLEKVSRIITDRYGLRLICEGDACKTDGRTIYLPSLPESMPDWLLGPIRGWADHECAHAIFTQTELGPVFKQAHGPLAFGILNTLEDARVEALMARRYPGSRLNLHQAFQFICSKLSQNPPPDPFNQFTSALYLRASGWADQPWVPADAYGLADECAAELSLLPSCRSTRQVAELALSIWEKVKEHFPQQQVDSEHDESNQPGGGATSPQGSDPPSQPPEGKDHTGQPGEPSQQPSQEDSAPAASPGGSTAGAFSPMEALGAEIAQEIRAQSAGDSRLGPYVVYTREHDVVEVPEPDAGYDYRREIESLRPYVGGLLRRLTQTLIGRRESRWLRDKSRGRLDPGSLHRLATGRSVRIFRQRAVSDGGPTACTLLLDLSSSMNGKQIEICRQLALVFGETLSRLGYPTEIIGFSTLDRDLRMEVAQATGQDLDDLARRYTRMVPLYLALFKQFDEPWRTAAKRLGAVQCRSLTPLGEALLFAGKRLAARPERRKVLFCLTDGQPVVGAWDEQVTLDHACDAVDRLADAGIEPVGIGIREACVEAIFPRHAVIQDLHDLPRGFVGQLAKVLTEHT